MANRRIIPLRYQFDDQMNIVALSELTLGDTIPPEFLPSMYQIDGGKITDVYQAGFQVDGGPITDVYTPDNQVFDGGII